MEHLTGRGRRLRRAALAAAVAFSPPAAIVGKQLLPPNLAASSKNTPDTHHTRSDNFLLSHKEIITDRDAAIARLIASVPPDPRLAHLRDAEHLRAEATMYSPDDAERRSVRSKSGLQLKQLADATPEHGYGFFAFADIDEGGTEHHRLYVMKKHNGDMRFVKGYKLSMGEKGFGNRKDSGQTPVGLRRFEYTFMGMHGEVVDATRESLPHFKLVVRDANGKPHHFVSTFDGAARREPAAVVTGRLTFDAARGIHLHQSNRTGYWLVSGDTKKWISMLGGPASGACGRMAGADFADAFRYVQAMVKENGVVTQGTPIYIHATPPVMERSRSIMRQPRDAGESASGGRRPDEGDRPRRGFNPFDSRSLN